MSPRQLPLVRIRHSLPVLFPSLRTILSLNTRSWQRSIDALKNSRNPSCVNQLVGRYLSSLGIELLNRIQNKPGLRQYGVAGFFLLLVMIFQESVTGLKRFV